MEEKLRTLLDNSYSPYSNFKVSAIVVLKDGRCFNGVNVENASYGASICAERSAIVSAISNGAKCGDFKALYIMNGSNNIVTPCFMCRQVISELFDLECVITCYNYDGLKEEYTVKELCPYPFGRDDLK